MSAYLKTSQKLIDIVSSIEKIAAVAPRYDSSIYNKTFKFPKVNGKISIFSPVGLDYASKIMRQLFPKWNKADHATASTEYKKELDKVEQKYKDVRNLAANESFGRNWLSSDYKVSGIGSNEFSDKRKSQLRKLNSSINMLSTLVHAHEKAAKSRNFVKEENMKKTADMLSKKDISKQDFCSALKQVAENMYVCHSKNDRLMQSMEDALSGYDIKRGPLAAVTEDVAKKVQETRKLLYQFNLELGKMARSLEFLPKRILEVKKAALDESLPKEKDVVDRNAERKERLMRELSSDLARLVESGDITEEEANKWMVRKQEQWFGGDK